MTTTEPKPRTGARVHVQKLGTSLSNMVMPNIGAFIAWGLITALFIKAGWLTGLFSGLRDPGGWVAKIGGWVMKKVDAVWDGKIRPGFEMLIDNFSAGIVGLILAVFGFFGIGPIVTAFSKGAGHVVDFLVAHNLLPLTSIFIEPAKVLFLNNAINHGVLTPLGTTQALETGKSVLFLLEANPGPGLGILLAYTVFGRGAAKASAPGAAIIQFFGGIHEIYFPYVLMKPKLIAATILGGMTGIFINVLFGSGLRAPAAPGSIIAVLAQTATGSYAGVILSVVGAAAVSFAVASLLLKTDRSDDGGDLAAATADMEALKGKKSSVSSALVGSAESGPITSIVFACDAGMGSSAMGASVLRKKVQGAGFSDVKVTNQSIANLTDTYGLVVTHQDLTARARQRTPSAVHVSVENFMNAPQYDEIVALLGKVNGGNGAAGTAPVVQAEESASEDALSVESIVLAGTATTRDGAIGEAGRLLVACGAVEPAYVEAMYEREGSVSTYMGNGLAIPHGTNDAKSAIKRTGISFVRYPEPIDWNGKPAEFVVGIAGAGKDHMALLTKIAGVFLNKDEVARLRQASTPEEVREVLGNTGK